MEAGEPPDAGPPLGGDYFPLNFNHHHWLGQPAGRQMTPLRELRVGMVGAGAWAQEIARCLEGIRGVRLTAVSNRSVDRARALARRHAIPSIFQDFRDLC